MSAGLILLVVILIALAGFFLGRRRAMVSVGGDPRKLHSLPGYYGQTVFIFAAAPALLLFAVWALLQPLYVENRVSGLIDPADIAEGSSLSLVMADVRRIGDGIDFLVLNSGQSETDIASMDAAEVDVRKLLAGVGVALGSDVNRSVFEAAKAFRGTNQTLHIVRAAVVILASLASSLFAYSRLTPEYRARNVTEAAIKALLIMCSTVAILTTVGIVFSLVFETFHFFQMYPAKDFFFNLSGTRSSAAALTLVSCRCCGARSMCPLSRCCLLYPLV